MSLRRPWLRDTTVLGGRRYVLFPTTSGQTVAVPAVNVDALAVPPAIAGGTATVSLTAASLAVLGIAPTIAQDVTVAVPVTTARILGVAPAVAATASLAVPFARVTDGVFVPAVTPSVTVAAGPSVLSLLAVAPTIEALRFVSPAVLTLAARAPSVTGGGGPGLLALPRKGGDSSTSMTVPT